MPKAVVETGYTERKELTTAPPDGYVELRRMTWGEFLQRRQMVMAMTVEGDRKKKNFSGQLDMANAKVTIFEFAHCVVDHNLEDMDGRKLNLAAQQDLMKLDPRIGQEISKYIDEMNNFNEEDEDLGNSQSGSE